jgi:hypothetical protein
VLTLRLNGNVGVNVTLERAAVATCASADTPWLAVSNESTCVL